MMAAFRHRGAKQSTCLLSLWLQLRALHQGNKHVPQCKSRLLNKYCDNKRNYYAFTYFVYSYSVGALIRFQ